MYCLSVRSIKNYEHRIECREFHFFDCYHLKLNPREQFALWCRLMKATLKLKSAMLPLCLLQKDIKIIAIVICLPFFPVLNFVDRQMAFFIVQTFSQTPTHRDFEMSGKFEFFPKPFQFKIPLIKFNRILYLGNIKVLC